MEQTNKLTKQEKAIRSFITKCINAGFGKDTFVATGKGGTGPTAVGMTAEKALGIKVNSYAGPDTYESGQGIELKAGRKKSKTPVSLMGKEAQFPDGKKRDKQNRGTNRYLAETFNGSAEGHEHGLYVTLRADKDTLFNGRRFRLQLTETDLNVLIDENVEVKWPLRQLKVDAENKLGHILCSFSADSSTNEDGAEVFDYTEANCYYGFSFDLWKTQIEKGNVVVDLRAHVDKSTPLLNRKGEVRTYKLTGEIIYDVRNHGTNFRTDAEHIQSFYSHQIRVDFRALQETLQSQTPVPVALAA